MGKIWIRRTAVPKPQVDAARMRELANIERREKRERKLAARKKEK